MSKCTEQCKLKGSKRNFEVHFFWQLLLRRGKKLMPKITITNIPNEMTDEALVTKIFNKDASLMSEINNDAIFSVIISWRSKRYTITPSFKNLMKKCSPQIRKHIMKDNDGYVYVGLSGCKSFDHYFLPHC